MSKIESDPGAWNVDELAAIVNLSKSRLRHLFKQETGTTAAHYLKTLRLRRSELMLRTTFLSVKEIVNKLGLGSISHFVREFKTVYGLTPTVYRQRNGPKVFRQRNRKEQNA